MTLDEFIAETIKDAEHFRAFWRSNQDGELTEHFPDDMPPGEWFEQFLAWVTGEGGEA